MFFKGDSLSQSRNAMTQPRFAMFGFLFGSESKRISPDGRFVRLLNKTKKWFSSPFHATLQLNWENEFFSVPTSFDEIYIFRFDFSFRRLSRICISKPLSWMLTDSIECKMQIAIWLHKTMALGRFTFDATRTLLEELFANSLTNRPRAFSSDNFNWVPAA